MAAAFIVDCLLVVTLISAFISGWRSGALSAILSAAGVIAGLIVSLALAPWLISLSDSRLLKLLILLGVVIVFVTIGNLGGLTVGGHIRNRARFRSSQLIGSVVGAFLQATATAFVVWFICLALASSIPGRVGDALRGSAVLRTIDAVAPEGLDKLPARVSAVLNEQGLPPLVSPFTPPVGQEVDAPDASTIDADMVQRVRPSVVHVIGEAQSCGRRMMGSGFVSAEDYIMTNAHVVAGTDTVSVDTVLGVKDATVVYYNPDDDIAILYVPRLGLDPIPSAETPLEAQDDAVVMGYPRSGPFVASPAKIRSRLTLAGPDIYALGRVEREAYTLRGDIQHGHSGGPLLTTQGTVAGMIFGASVDGSSTGYALTLDQIQSQIGDITTLTTAVDTQGCIAA